jgi:hypothetical protein
MPTRILLLVGLLLSAVGCSTAYAEAKKPPGKSSTKETIRYFQFSDDLFGDLAVDGFLREVRQGATVVSASLDVCHSISQTSSRKDRFVVPLRVEGGKLIGTGQSQEDSVPVAVSLVRKQTKKTTAFEGSITRGSIKTNVSSTDNTDMSESEFRERQVPDTSIASQPKDFTEISPDSVTIGVKRDSFAGVVKNLKSEACRLWVIVACQIVPPCGQDNK